MITTSAKVHLRTAQGTDGRGIDFRKPTEDMRHEVVVRLGQALLHSRTRPMPRQWNVATFKKERPGLTSTSTADRGMGPRRKAIPPKMTSKQHTRILDAPIIWPNEKRAGRGWWAEVMTYVEICGSGRSYGHLWREHAGQTR